MRNIPLWRFTVIVLLLLYALVNVQLVTWLQGPCKECPSCGSCTSDVLPQIQTTLSSSYIHRNVTNTITTATLEARKNQSHHLAVVVPFRNRWEELMEFGPHMHSFLARQNVSHDIWVINQVDKHRFNRASLLNIGFQLTHNVCDHIVMHDVDLLPMNDQLKYDYHKDGPYHIASPQLHPRYHYEKFVGGILMLTREQFMKVNGLSNIFWGWGREDDELYLRMIEAGMKIHRPEGVSTGYETFKHIHDKAERPRDMNSYHNQYKMSRKRDRETGLNTVKFDLISTTNLVINNTPLTLVNVQVHCDYKKTPFCDHPS